MLPRTIHSLVPHDCISALQKFVRRGMEREAMEVACELGHTSKSYATWVANRLVVMSYEDVGLADPSIIPLVRTACDQAREWYRPEDLGYWRMAIGTAIRALARAAKSREGDHFQAAVGLRMELEDAVPMLPDFVFDKHTIRGKKQGRGIEHFRAEAAKLVPAPATADPYEEEAYRLWKLQQTKGRRQSPPPPAKDQPQLF